MKKRIVGLFSILCFLLIAVCLMPGVRSYAQEGYTVNGLWWGFEKATGTITWIPWDWEGGAIPEEIEGVKVVALSDDWVCLNRDGKRDHISEIILPKGLQRIGNGAFYNLKIKSITIPDGVTYIGDSAFSGCAGLKSINIPEGVTSIGRSAFSECISLEEIVLPKTLESLGSSAFYGCTALTGAVISGHDLTIESRSFQECSKLDHLTVSGNNVEIGDWAFRECTSLTSVDLQEGVTAIGSGAFRGCSRLTKVNIPKSMKTIGDYAFDGCEDLEEVNYAGKESSITFGKSVYARCIWLHPDFSEPYRTSKYYRNLMSLKLTGNYVEDAIAIAASQEGYNEGKSFEDLDGMNRDYSKAALKDYTEFNYYIGRPEWLWRPGLSEVTAYGGWCGQFCGWCLNMAGIPDEAHQYLNDEQDEEHVLWKDTVYAGGQYKVKPGDVLHMKEGHFALVVEITEKKNSVVFGTWNGNWPGVVWHEFEYSKKDGKMVDRSWSGDDLTEILKFEPEVIEKLSHYTVKFDANGGKTSIKSKDICQGAYFGIMPVPTRDGYTFDGWYTEKTGGKKITAYRKAREIGNITLYAHWKDKSGKSGDDSNDGSSDIDVCEKDATPDVMVSKKTVKYSVLKNSEQIVVINRTGCDCTASYSNKTKGKLKKYVSVSKSGVVTIAQNAPKGTVKIKVTLKPLSGGDKVVKTVKIKVK